MPTLAAPIIDRVYMIDYYMAGSEEERRLFWADEGTNTIATATIQGSKPTNIIDLPLGKAWGGWHSARGMDIVCWFNMFCYSANIKLLEYLCEFL